MGTIQKVRVTSARTLLLAAAARGDGVRPEIADLMRLAAENAACADNDLDAAIHFLARGSHRDLDSSAEMPEMAQVFNLAERVQTTAQQDAEDPLSPRGSAI